MLRSLVGSEMCIRDSYKIVFELAGHHWHEAISRKAIDHALQHVTRVKICLLYTSDAADDLLCVDLGGRRIIKKKKK